MRLVTVDEMRAIEKSADLDYDLSDEILMETAGLLASREIETSFLPEIHQGRIAVLCGPGNNGGDALVVARHLLSRGYLSLHVFFVGENKDSDSLFARQKKRAEKAGVRLGKLSDVAQLKDFTLYLDGLFGIGLRREIEGKFREVIEFLNQAHAPVVSLDVPSGLDSDSGKVWGVTVRAAMTLAFGLAKPGLFTASGAEATGQLRVVPLGLPRLLLRDHAKTYFAINRPWAKRWLPKRDNEANKFTGGRLLVVAGQPGTWGAAAMCTQGAYRIGAGYVTLVAQDAETAKKYLASEVGPEILVSSLEKENLLGKVSAVIVGPGVGTSEKIKNFITSLSEAKFSQVVLDADALTCLSEMPGLKIPSSWVLTPHTGELSRLLKVTSKEIEADRFHFAKLAAERFGCYVLLKGFHSVLADSHGKVGIIDSGNAALAKAGTGDVLSGFIGGLMSQGLSSLAAAGTGAYLHGLVADDWVRRGNDPLSFLATDLLAEIGQVLTQVNHE